MFQGTIPVFVRRDWRTRKCLSPDSLHSAWDWNRLLPEYTSGECYQYINLLSQMATNYLHGSESFLRTHQLCSYSRISQHFMEPEGSLPCSQEPILSQINPVHTTPSYLSKIHSTRNMEDIEGSCKYTEYAVADSRQGVVLRFGGLAWG
jgi:hypothetical protein